MHSKDGIHHLVVELDGSQHYTEQGLLKDNIRTEKIEKYGLLVLRIPNNEVNRNLAGVCDYIEDTVQKRLQQTEKR